MPGAPGMKVYSKDDLMNGMPNFSGDGDEEEEDEDEDESALISQVRKLKKKMLFLLLYASLVLLCMYALVFLF